MNYREAIKNIVINKGVEARCNSFRAYVYDNEKFNIGTYATEEEARLAVCNYWINRFDKAIFSNGMNPFDGVVIFNDYVLYPNGRLFNLKGEELNYEIGPGGRPYTVYIHSKSKNIKNIYEQVFGVWPF